jgi:hypothetical protein
MKAIEMNCQNSGGDLVRFFESMVQLRELKGIASNGNCGRGPEGNGEEYRKLLGLWLLRNGFSPLSNCPMNRIGIYTDFT